MDAPTEEKHCPIEKHCRFCGQTKPASEFGRDRKSKDGYRGRCRPCTNDYWRERAARLAAARGAGDAVFPEAKTCLRCGEVKSRTRDFHPQRTSPDGYRPDCRDCKRKTWQEAYQRDHDTVLAQRAARRTENRERSRAERRAKYAQNPEKYREQLRKYRREHPGWSAAQQRKWREAHQDHVRDRSRKYYRLHAETLCQNRRVWRKAHLEHVQRQERDQAQKHREVRRHRCRVWYWANPQRARMLARLSREKSDREQSGKAPESGKYRRTVSLDDTFGQGGRLSRLDRTVDTRVVSPETAAVEAPSRQAVRAFVDEALSEEERQVLEAFADSFSVEGTAELLSITPAEVEATLTAIRSRAAALGSSVDGQES